MSNIKHLKRVFIFSIANCLFACASLDQKKTVPIATLLNAEQAVSYISGKTEIWTADSGYAMVPYTFRYGPDGVMEVYWKGEKVSGKWEVSNEGMVCYQIPQWEQYCYYYINANGSIRRVYTGSAR